ncbi:MAG: DegT/DnrJ/EryC1/StrS family aminotransferase [Candidatus Omnitrophota bacterium]
MISKIPISASKISLLNIISAFPSIWGDKEAQEEFKETIGLQVYQPQVILLNSGLAALYVILLAIKKNSSKTEVILPAYTAGSLIVAIKKAGLKPVLCDISPQTFNLDSALLDKLVCHKTLCIIGVHMFGVVMPEIKELKQKFPDVYILEDACQSYGAEFEFRRVGWAGDISFFSFNRGKNTTSFGGGAIATGNDEVYQKLLRQIEDIKKPSVFARIKIWVKMIVLFCVLNKWVYGFLFGFISQFKENKPPVDIQVSKFTEVQAKIGMFALENCNNSSGQRLNNGMKIIKACSDIKDIILPKIEPKTKPAFNRLPIVFSNPVKREQVEKALAAEGIETSRMYLKPLHLMFDLGYKKGDFPQAEYLADNLLTLPTHPLMTDSDIDYIIDVIKKA